MKGFNISFTVTTPESAEAGEYAECGFRDTGLTLREAFNALRFEGHATQADCWPVSLRSPPRWLEFGPSLTGRAKRRRLRCISRTM
jgi:hypothetical protein